MFDGLTDHQRNAVAHVEGPLLVLAGPGSGKTRVITCRIAALLQAGVHPSQVLALTFTNKAAGEMSGRVHDLLGGLRVQVSTFHRFCARLLRQFAPAVGLRENFTILDQRDQVQLIRRIMKEESLDAVFHDPSKVLGRISRARNDLIDAETYRQQHESRVGDALSAVVCRVFPLYEQRVRQQNAVDFDDLLLHVVRLLDDDAEIREALDDRFRFVLVDEYQDTNRAQYRIVRAMSQRHPNLCATGDPDQSIYGWRGACPENITDFKRDYRDARIVSLDRNFRSTQQIVRCADRLISHNPRPHRNPADSPNEEGVPVRLIVSDDAGDEAERIAEDIADRVVSGERRFADFAVFYRINALSRSVETALTRRRIPFQVASGASFYDRAEIRDLIAYLRLIENAADAAAMERIINRPARGIGAKTVSRLVDYARRQGLSLFAAAQQARNIPGLAARSAKRVLEFVDLIKRLHEQSADGMVAPVLERLIAEINYLSVWSDADDTIETDRAANVDELISAARQFDESDPGEDGGSLQGFLELAGLSSEADSVDDGRGAVTLMTIHAAKGLEFPEVFLIAVENGVIPHERAVRHGDPKSFEEERRLMYVGMTRAQQRLTLTMTRERAVRGVRRSTIRSPYLDEIRDHLQTDDGLVLPAATRLSASEERLAAARARFAAAQESPGRRLLVTAAELESARRGDTPGDTGFAEGMLVRHPRYGRGVVTGVSGMTSRSTVSVAFEIDGRCETFVVGMAPLQPIGPQM